MRIEGRQTYAATPEILWSLLHDPLVLERVLPGCESLESIGPNEYRLTLTIRLGQAYERLSGILHFQRVDPYQGFDFVAEWADRGGALAGRGRVVLESQEGGTTTLSYEADFDAGGRFTEISPRMLQTTARAFARRSLEALESQVALRVRVFTTTTVRPLATRTAMPEGHAPAARLRGLLAVVSLLLAIALFRRGLGRRRTQAAIRPVATPE